MSKDYFHEDDIALVSSEKSTNSDQHDPKSEIKTETEDDFFHEDDIALFTGGSPKTHNDKE